MFGVRISLCGPLASNICLGGQILLFVSSCVFPSYFAPPIASVAFGFWGGFCGFVLVWILIVCFCLLMFMATVGFDSFFCWLLIASW